MKLQFTKVGALMMILATAACSAAAPGDIEVNEADLSSASASASSAGATAVAQMNDLSVLYPLAKSASEITTGYLAASGKGLGGEFIPEAMFEKATGLPAMPKAPGGIGSSPTMAYDHLRAVAFRLDPCFAQIGPITDPASCQNQLRIVFQDVTSTKGRTSMFDGAVHVFYSLTRAELTETIQSIIALRIANGGTADMGPVAVHPILAKQGLGGKMAKGLNAIVASRAGASNLTHFTVFQGSNLDTAWTFQAYDVKNGVAKPSAVASIAGAAGSEIFAKGFSADLAGTFEPAPKPTDDVTLLTNLANATAATGAERQSAFDAALRIENPTFDSPNTVDCASCHMAEPARLMVAAKFDLKASAAEYAFVADATSVPAADMARTTPFDSSSGLNLHAFSYDGAVPMINQRVVNETAANVTYVNHAVLNALTH